MNMTTHMFFDEPDHPDYSHQRELTREEFLAEAADLEKEYRENYEKFHGDGQPQWVPLGPVKPCRQCDNGEVREGDYVDACPSCMGTGARMAVRVA